MKNFDPKAWFMPQAVIIIGTYDADGTPNAMNAAWAGQWDGDKIMISMGNHQTTVNLGQPLAVVLDDVEGVHAELDDDEFGELRSDALDKSAAEVLLQSEECGGHGFLVALHYKLTAILPVDFPLTIRDEHSAYGHVEHITDKGDEVVVPLHPCLQY